MFWLIKVQNIYFYHQECCFLQNLHPLLLANLSDICVQNTNLLTHIFSISHQSWKWHWCIVHPEFPQFWNAWLGMHDLFVHACTNCLFDYSFFIEGKSTSVTSTAFQAGPHFTENNIYIIIIQYIQYLQYTW